MRARHRDHRRARSGPTVRPTSLNLPLPPPPPHAGAVFLGGACRDRRERAMAAARRKATPLAFMSVSR
jgi:hypothetical protein